MCCFWLGGLRLTRDLIRKDGLKDFPFLLLFIKAHCPDMYLF